MSRDDGTGTEKTCGKPQRKTQPPGQTQQKRAALCFKTGKAIPPAARKHPQQFPSNTCSLFSSCFKLLREKMSIMSK